MLDTGVVDRLRNVGGDALVRRMVRLFVVTSEEAMQRINVALAHGSLATVQAAAHHLFSSAAQLRLGEIADAAERLETAARAGNAAAAHSCAAELPPILARVTDGLRDLLKQLPEAARVVVVDDSEDIRVLLRLVLEPHFDVAEYSNASSALAAVRRFPPDIMLIDLSLPDMRGVDLLHVIRGDAELQKIPAIAITALDLPDGRTFEESGFNLHIRKPIVDTDEVVRAVSLLLKEHQTWR